ncbi:YciI-like protein [Sinorhizobium sp. BG8]|uniref:YciI-like protein n=1 Tax=Sinorhizobium sp. BG8 TaxID=2613773 RepID=UPI00193D98A6|nr:YciI-like protein [Sinorhizobium sp. BG8]QRM53450.1 hypothetical protein F3Y30_01885 [Sinorhizobium sp. BG8]
MYFALLCTDKPNSLQLRLDTRPAHVEHLNRLNAEGRLAFAGPFLDGDGKPNGSLVVVKADSFDAARALAEADPFSKAGLFATVDVKPWTWTFNKPEA